MGLKIFSGTSSKTLSQEVLKHFSNISPLLNDGIKNNIDYLYSKNMLSNLGTSPKLGDIQISRFPDDELNIKINENVRGVSAFIIQSTCPPVNESLMELLLSVDAFKRSSSGEITAIIPYFGYARKDRKDEGRVPISSKLVANLLVTSGVGRILTIDLHAEQIQGFFDIPVDHLYAYPVITNHLKRNLDIENLVVVTPDLGSSKLARNYANRLNTDIAIIDKKRINGEETKVQNLIGDVKGKNALIVDDILSTGGSVVSATEFLKKSGAKKVYIACTHGVFCGNYQEKLKNADYEKIFVTDTVNSDFISDPSLRSSFRVEIVSVSKLLAYAIQHIYMRDSVSSIISSEDIF